MATSQEWIIDQKERVFLKVKTKKKISKDLFRNRSDSAIRFRSNPVENYGSIYLNFFLEKYGEYGHMPNSVIEFMNKVLWSHVRTRIELMKYDRQFCKMLPVSQKLHVIVLVTLRHGDDLETSDSAHFLICSAKNQNQKSENVHVFIQYYIV